MKKILELILAPILGPIKIVLTLVILVGGAYWTHQQGMWSLTSLLTPDWMTDIKLPALHDGDSTIIMTPDHLLVTTLRGEGQALPGATIEVMDTIFYNRVRAQGYLDNEADFYEKRSYPGTATLCVSTETVQLYGDADTLGFYFPTPQICFAGLAKGERVIEGTEWNRMIPVDTAEAYRQEMRDLAAIRVQNPATYLAKDRESLRALSEKEVAKTLHDLCGSLMVQYGDQRIIAVRIAPL